LRGQVKKSLFGQAIEYSRDQWASLVRYLDDARFAVDNGEAERAIRPLAVGRSNWLHVGGDGGLKTAAVLLSVCGSATRHRLNPWSYVRDVLDQLAARSADADVSDLLPDARAVHHARLKINEELVKAGVLLAAEGLQPSSKGVRVRFSGDKRTVIDGPFTETKELVAGFSLWEVKSMEEAIEWVKRYPNCMPGGTRSSRSAR
jgi:hypothetical protein